MSRILQVANFVAPHSGGIRTVLEQLAARSGIPSAVVSHERLDRPLQQWLPAAVDTVRLPDRSKTFSWTNTVASFDPGVADPGRM